MNFNEKKRACMEYFNNLCNELKETHSLVGSCNKDCSLYLVPKGTEKEITYSSKPVNSYRFSDHWNWYSNIKKCSDPHYIQCFNIDAPRVKQRIEPGKASKPVLCICVAYFGEDEKYHHVYGEKFDRDKKKWSFG